MVMGYFPLCSLKLGTHCSWEAVAHSRGVVADGESEGAWPQVNAVTQASVSKAFERRFYVNSDLSDQLVWHLFLPVSEKSERMKDKVANAPRLTRNLKV